MPRSSVSRADAGDPGSGLRELLDLITRELGRLGGSAPKLCVAGGSIGRLGAAMAAADATAGGRATRLVAGPAILPSPVDNDDGARAEAEHAEVWEWVRRAQGGDGEAFGLLYDRYVDIVFRFVYYRVNDRALAEDFTSETFLRALRRIGSLHYQGRDVGAWFVTIARNIVFDHTKSARHRLETTTAELADNGDPDPGPEATAIAGLTAATLQRAIAQLGSEQRECIQLRFIQGLSVSETAAALGKNDGAVKALQHRAIRKLATLVGEELQ